jgi:hypothetical protein
MHELAKLVVTQLVVPDGGRTDEEVLTLTVDLVSKKGISELRAELHEAIASVKEDGVRDETVVAEIDEMLRAFNEAVAKKTNGSVARTCLTGLSWAAGGFALWCPPVGALVGPAAKLGDVVVTKVFGGEEPAKGSGLELLAAAQKALAAD